MQHLPTSRSRRLIGVILTAVIIIGLASRLGGQRLPRLIAKDLGDVLWALMFFLIVLLLRPRSSTRFAAIMAMGGASAVEFLKLYHGEWIESLRGNAAGALLFGRVFLWGNVLSYAIGTLGGIVVDLVVLRRGRGV